MFNRLIQIRLELLTKYHNVVVYFKYSGEMNESKLLIVRGVRVGPKLSTNSYIHLATVR